MPRGKTARTRKKMAKAEEQGKLKARIEEEAKTFSKSKNFIVWVKKLIENHVDKIPKMVAIMGLTLLVHETIEKTEVYRQKITTIVKGEAPWWSYFYGVTGLIGLGFQMWLTPEAKEEVSFKTSTTYETMSWLTSFTLAYIIIEHGGQIALGLGDVAKSLTGMVGFLLG